MGDLDGAVKILDDAMAKMGESPVLLRNRAAHLVAGRRWAAAADTLKRMARAYPNDIDVLLEWGRIAEAAGQTADAAEAFQRAWTLTPESPEVMLSLAGILMVQEEFDKAEEVLRSSIKQHPRLTDARLKLSKLLLRRDRTMDALSAADAAVAVDRNAADGHCARGIVLLEMAQPMLAVLAFRRALALEPKHREARMQLRRIRRGPDPQPLREVAPPSTPWTGTLVTDNATFGRKIAYSPQSPGKALKFGDSRTDDISYKAAALVHALLPSGTVLASLLDLRCGTGLFAALLHRHVRAKQTIGVGPSLLKLGTAKRKGVFTEFIEGDG
jgi:tetratricopeptide (TPR) repeat protein